MAVSVRFYSTCVLRVAVFSIRYQGKHFLLKYVKCNYVTFCLRFFALHNVERYLTSGYRHRRRKQIKSLCVGEWGWVTSVNQIKRQFAMPILYQAPPHPHHPSPIPMPLSGDYITKITWTFLLPDIILIPCVAPLVFIKYSLNHYDQHKKMQTLCVEEHHCVL